MKIRATVNNTLDDERAQKHWNAEVDRYEKAVKVSGVIGRMRNPDQKLKPPTIVCSKRQSGRVSSMVVPNFRLVYVWQSEK